MTPELTKRFADWALRSCPSESRTWFEHEMLRAGTVHSDIRGAFAGAGRRLGQERLTLNDDQARGYEGSFSNWTVTDVGRVALLLEATRQLPSEGARSLAEDLYFRGDLGEKRAVLLVLSFLTDPEGYVELGIESCRTNALDLFATIACGNPFPARHFPELHFNQMVVKTVFLGLSARRIVGLHDRVTPTLARMLTDYESERKAADRSVPDDIAWILSLMHRDILERAT